MSTFAVTPATHNPVQPLFIECNGSPLDQYEEPIQIKASPLSDEDEDYSMQNNVDGNYDGISSDQVMKEDNEIDINDDLYLGDVNYCSLPNEINGALLSNKFDTDSLPTELNDCSTTQVIKEEPCTNTVPTDVMPVRDIVPREMKNMYVPVEVKDEAGLKIIENILIPIQQEDGSVSYEIRNVVMPMISELRLPRKRRKPMPVKVIRPIKPKPERCIVQIDETLKETEVQTVVANIESAGLEKNEQEKAAENSEKVPTSRTLTDEVDRMLEDLRNVCPLCQKSFKTQKQMDKHILRNHKKQFRCKMCDDSYSSQDALDEHLKTHDKDTHVDCPFCRQKYKSMSRLKAHQIRVHSTVDPETIGGHGNNEAVVTKCGLENQKVGQLRTKTFVCEYCDNAYWQHSYLVAHKRIAHGILKKGPKKFQCNVCNRKFLTECSLRSHASLHEQKFLCDHCGKELANKYSLQLHTRQHTGERPYKCKVCLKTFTASVVLRVHMLTHTGTRPYKCDICGQKFTQRSSMMVHRRKHPGNHPRPPPVFLGNVESKGN